MRWERILAILAISIPLAAPAGNPESGREGLFALGIRASTLGLGGDLAIPLASWATLRGGGHRLSYSGTYEHDNIDYDMDLSFANAVGWLDLHPFQNSFRLTGGYLSLDHALTGLATPTKNVRIGGGVFTPAQVGTLTMRVDYPTYGWYAGLGFGNAFSKSGRWSGSFDLGVVMHAEPDFSLTSNGSLSQNPMFQDQLNKTREDIREDLIQKLRYWPVLSFGIAFRF